jgi:multicomponent Na+:H+ antiporter subunit G
MQTVLEIIAALGLLLGAFFIVVSGIGMIRFPDVFCRMHATGKAGTLGIVFMLLGTIVFFLDSDRSVLFRGMLAIFFQFLTTPAATHLLARAAYIRQYPVSDRTAVDELKAFLPSLPDEAVGGKE